MSKKQLTKTDALCTAVGIGGLTQLSRNKRIRNAGDTLLIFTLIIAIGELIKWLFKWIIWKPCILFCKLLIKATVWIAKSSYHYLKILLKHYIKAKQVEKTI